MESYIKIKATASEMRKFFEKDAGVRYYKIEKKQGGELCIFSVLYRHAELEKPLRGTFTIETLVKKIETLRKFA